MDGKSAREVRRMAQDVRRELRRMAEMMDEGDLEWTLIHAQQAAASACEVEDLVRAAIAAGEVGAAR